MRPTLALIYYSQSGQSQKLASELKARLLVQDVKLVEVPVRSREPFHFPWRASDFFAQMPRAVEAEKIAIDEEALPSLDEVDAVFLIHPVWFLSASLPIQALLQSSWAQKELKSRKLFQVLTCRNMWYMAAHKTQQALEELGLAYFGHVALCDPSPNWASLLTTPLWMLTGKKQALGFLPPAGIPEQHIKEIAVKLAEGARVFDKNSFHKCVVKDFVSVDRSTSVTLVMEIIVHKFVFRPWARVIFLSPSRFLKHVLLLGFCLNLVLAIFVLVPSLAIVSRVASRSILSFAGKRMLK